MPETESKYVLYVHYDSSIKKVSDFLDGPKAITGMSESDFLKYSPTELKREKEGKKRNIRIQGTSNRVIDESRGNADRFEPSNLERIYGNYDPDDKKKYKADFEAALSIITSGGKGEISWSGPLLINTHLAVPSDKLRREIVAMKGKNVVSNERSTTAFVGDRLASLLRDPGYQKYSSARLGAVKKEHPTISVWIWVRAMSNGAPNEDLEGTILDISNYVETCQTHVSETGGNFTITLPPIMTDFTGNMWRVDESSLMRKASGKYVSKGSLNKVEKGQLKRNNFFFHTAISKNDVVWIRMETLASEQEARSKEEVRENDVVQKEELPGKVYDMIGLVDNCTQVSNFEATDVVTTINGRDLVKLIIDDGAYLQPLLFFKENFLGEKGQVIQRNAIDGAYADLSFARYNTVEEALSFLINVVSNIEVTPDSLFDAYEKSSQSLEVTEGVITDGQKKQLAKLQEEGVNYIREAAQQRNLPIPLTNSNSQLVLWNHVLDFAKKKYDTSPKVKEITWGSYKNVFPFTVLTDPDRKGTEIDSRTSSSGVRVESIKNVNYKGTTSNIPGKQGQFTESPYLSLAIVAALNYLTLKETQKPVPVIKPKQKGIWQIIELVIDKGVRHRTIADTSLSQPNGSLISQFFKYCQKPFVEFYTDTYGDKFNFIVREPPFDQARILDFIDTGLINKLTVDDADVINENFSFSTEAYSWYEIDPQSVNFGKTDSIFSKIPIVLFDEFAKIFGSSKMSVVSNYISWIGRVHEGEEKDSNYLLEQVLIDLKYLIDCYSYLPFTREGTIVINGDRRFKRGTWMRYASTGEIFYIDEVTNDYLHTGDTIDRVTLLKVSRGMVEKYVTGEVTTTLGATGQSVPVTYFNIVDTDLILEYAREQVAIDGVKKITINPKSVNKVRPEIFNFFMKRQQFSGIGPLKPYIGTIEDGSRFSDIA